MKVDFDRERLSDLGIELSPGLSNEEVDRVEETFEFAFPPDLREFLQMTLPVGGRFVDWRNDSEETIRSRIDWPFEGMCFDIESNSFWPSNWGPWPDKLDEAFAIAKERINNAPKLIPVYSHRYIPDYPHEAGNPIFSVYQTDIVMYGTNFEAYLENEFAGIFTVPLNTRGRDDAEKRIPFWSNLIDYVNGSSSSV